MFSVSGNQENGTATNHSEIALDQSMEQMDNMDHHHEEYMSPFLPELDNDTFLPEHHLIEHNLVPNEQDENVPSTKPPNLEFDQLNHTNPFDNFTSEALGVIPLNRSILYENVSAQEMQENVTLANSE